MTHPAAWLNAPFAPFTVSDAPDVPPQAGQILVRNRALAINPIDRYKQKMGNMLYGWLNYPMVIGFDLAGEVIDVGPGVTRFHVGDRVLAHATGVEKTRNRTAEAAFQSQSVVMAHMASPIPDTLSYEAAAVIPLALSTAACGLFGTDQLGLDLPADTAVDKKSTVVIWGGSTSVGCNAIQLAKAAGYRVVTTASPANADYVTALGADAVFDYRDRSAIARIREAIRTDEIAGALAMGEGSAMACIKILAGCRGAPNVALATFPLDIDALPDGPGHWTALTRMLPMMISGGGRMWLTAKLKGVRLSVIWGSALMNTDLGPAIYDGFLPSALRSGRYVAAPPPLIAGHGLEALEQALQRQKQGVSAAKVVVTL